MMQMASVKTSMRYIVLVNINVIYIYSVYM